MKPEGRQELLQEDENSSSQCKSSSDWIRLFLKGPLLGKLPRIQLWSEIFGIFFVHHAWNLRYCQTSAIEGTRLGDKSRFCHFNTWATKYWATARNCLKSCLKSTTPWTTKGSTAGFRITFGSGLFFPEYFLSDQFTYCETNGPSFLF